MQFQPAGAAFFWTSKVFNEGRDEVAKVPVRTDTDGKA